MRAAEAAAPIADGELDSLFHDVASASRIALAVSGGADSLALLDCVERWHRRGGRPEPVVLTVDHRLRPESAGEASAVAAAAAGRGLRSRVLVWEGAHPQRDAEATARMARYRLLLGAAREEGISHLLLAHHRDDQAETFLIRLTRGSGLFGLAAMRPAVRSGDIMILRPFLEIPRSRLAATTAVAGLTPAEDPMNRDPRYLRARIRRLMPLLAMEGLDPAVLAATARCLAVAADAIEAAADAAIAGSVFADQMGIAWVDPVLFRAPVEVQLRVLTRLVMAIGGEPYPPRAERLASLREAMAARRGRFKRTLSGSVIEGRGDRFALYREIGRDGLPVISLEPGRQNVWDHRFAVEAGADLPAGLSLGALGEEGRLAIGERADRAPAGALAALPAIRRGAEIVAVPVLGRGSASLPLTVQPILAARIANPPRFPDFSGV